MAFLMYVLQGDDRPFLQWLSHATSNSHFSTFHVIFTPAPVDLRNNRFLRPRQEPSPRLASHDPYWKWSDISQYCVFLKQNFFFIQREQKLEWKQQLNSIRKPRIVAQQMCLCCQNKQSQHVGLVSGCIHPGVVAQSTVQGADIEVMAP